MVGGEKKEKVNKLDKKEIGLKLNNLNSIYDYSGLYLIKDL